MTTNSIAAPFSTIDLFSQESLRDPFDDYRRLRDLGPVVRLQHPDVFALSRFDTVQSALRQSDIFINGKGVGFNDPFNAVRAASVVQSDGDLHRRLKSVVIRPLMPQEIAKIRAELKQLISEQIDKLVGQGEFDAMIQIARHLPVEAVSHFVGLPQNGRERMLDWAAAGFNAIGPEYDPGDFKQLAEAAAFLLKVRRADVRPGSWSDQLFEAVEAGMLTLEEAGAALGGYVMPSLDTTILATGHLLNNLARSPEQWTLLKSEPDLIPAAVIEGVRHSAVIRWFARVATQDAEIEGVRIPEGSRLMLIYASANRDERHYPDPDRFNIKRKARDQLAWGVGAHTCLGMHLARVEMEVLLEVLVEKNVTLSAGEPVVGTNQGLYGFASLPFQLN